MTPTCPTHDVLVAAFEAGALAPELLEHSATCEDCAARLRLLDDLSRARLEPVPDRVLRAALAIPETERPARPSLTDAIRSFVGKLIEGTVAPAMAFRGGESGARAHRVYEAGPYEIDVTHLENGALVGQIDFDDGTPELGAAACTLYGDGWMRNSALRSDGGFRFSDVGAGKFVLIVDGEGAQLVLPELEL